MLWTQALGVARPRREGLVVAVLRSGGNVAIEEDRTLGQGPIAGTRLGPKALEPLGVNLSVTRLCLSR
jgi:hypothetical protein